MKALWVVVLALSVVCAYAQTPTRCKSPPAWEAQYYSTKANSSEMIYGKFFYDAANQRMGLSHDIYLNNQEIVSEQKYFFYKENYGLKYNVKTKQCVKFDLVEPFYVAEVPPTAKFIDTLVIGSNAAENLGLTVNVWSYQGMHGGRAIMEWLADDKDGDEGCLPVGYTEFGGAPGSGSYRRMSFFNIELGMNPDHFIPPSECPRPDVIHA